MPAIATALYGVLVPEFRAEDLKAVSDFLDQRWDPIGVYRDLDVDVPAGEYASYAPAILGDLYADATVDDVLHHMRQARKLMSLQDAPDRGRDVDAAHALLSWWADRACDK